MSPKTKDEGGGRVKRKGKVKHQEPYAVFKDGVKITEFKSQTLVNMQKKVERFPGRKAVDPKLIAKYSKGEGVQVKKMKRVRPHIVEKIKKKEQKFKQVEEEAARNEVLLTETGGFLEVEEGLKTSKIKQKDIKKAVDITSASKIFDLTLDFGPYYMDFTRNGRHLLLGGRMGHLASFDWITKKLHFEINVMESIHDVKFLHTEEMMAVAQKSWVYIYDNQGVELHCLKMINKCLQLEFLPYHFLLCAGSHTGWLSWLDISLGQDVIKTYTGKGQISNMCQNPYNAVLCCGHANGTVTMWTPNSNKPAASILCHPRPIQSMTVDPSGRYLATAGVDSYLKIWDARSMGSCLQSYRLGTSASNLAFSQRGLLAASMGNVVEVYRDALTGGCKKAYMQHRGETGVKDMHFCPYEDILGISTQSGYSSLIIPGSGEPNFDALEANPYISRSGQNEAEVKALLAKIPSDLITLDPSTICQVDVPTLEEKLEAKNALLHIKKPEIDAKPRYRMKGKSGSVQTFKRKKKIKEARGREYLQEMQKQAELAGIVKKTEQAPKDEGILGRFKPKKK